MASVMHAIKEMIETTRHSMNSGQYFGRTEPFEFQKWAIYQQALLFAKKVKTLSKNKSKSNGLYI